MSDLPRRMPSPALPGILAVGLVALLVVVGLGRSVLTIRTTGAPWGSSARVGDAIVTMITRLDPYVPTLNRNAGNDRYTIGLLVQSARDDGVRRFVRLATGQPPASLTRARIVGVEEGRVSFLAPESGSFDPATGVVAWHPNGPRPERATPLAELATGAAALEMMFVAGTMVSPDRWLGVLSDPEAAGYRTGMRPPGESSPDRSRDPRRLRMALLTPGVAGPRIDRIDALPGDGMLNAAFVRDRRLGEILRLSGDGYLLAWDSKPYGTGTTMLARVAPDGSIAWTRDSGIGTLREVLPDPAFPALIGERPRVADSVPEPILVVVDAATGTTTTRSLWMRQNPP